VIDSRHQSQRIPQRGSVSSVSRSNVRSSTRSNSFQRPGWRSCHEQLSSIRGSLGFWGQYESSREVDRVISETLGARIERAFMKTTAQKTKSRAPLPEFVQQGLRAHREATRNVHAEERRLGIKRDPAIIAAIRKKFVLKFIYNGELRTVEPQTYGLSTAGKEVLRAYQKSGGAADRGSRALQNCSIWRKSRSCELRVKPLQKLCPLIIPTTARWWRCSLPCQSRRRSRNADASDGGTVQTMFEFIDLDEGQMEVGSP
jgi:hypothetical protein